MLATIDGFAGRSSRHERGNREAKLKLGREEKERAGWKPAVRNADVKSPLQSQEKRPASEGGPYKGKTEEKTADKKSVWTFCNRLQENLGHVS